MSDVYGTTLALERSALAASAAGLREVLGQGDRDQMSASVATFWRRLRGSVRSIGIVREHASLGLSESAEPDMDALDELLALVWNIRLMFEQNSEESKINSRLDELRQRLATLETLASNRDLNT